MPVQRNATRAAFIVALVVLAGCGRSPSAPVEPRATPASRLAAGVAIDEDFTGRQVFPTDNWWNLDITTAPVDPNSQAFIDWISGRTPQNPNATARLHPDFGPPPYGIPYVGVSGTQPLLPVTFSPYGNESDTGAPGRPPGYPIPDEAKTQANYIEGGVAGGGPSGDRHLILIDRDHWLLFETFATRWNAAAGRWDAGSGATWTKCGRPWPTSSETATGRAPSSSTC